MTKRAVTILAVMLVAGLMPVAVTAKGAPSPPATVPDCQFVDGGASGVLVGTTGDYMCRWQAWGEGEEPLTSWTVEIAVLPEGASANLITLAVKDDHLAGLGGDLCPTTDGELKPQVRQVSGGITVTYELPADGNCVDFDGDTVPAGVAGEFVFFMDSLLKRGLAVSVMLVPTTG
jgi:hypothetical protein